MAALSGINPARFIVKAASDTAPPSKSIKTVLHPCLCLNRGPIWGRVSITSTGGLGLGLGYSSGRVVLVVAAAAPDSLSEKVAQSVKDATEVCSDDPVSGECVAAWDEVEELSAAASHARDKKKTTTPIDEFCKDNPEDEECRTYED